MVSYSNDPSTSQGSDRGTMWSTKINTTLVATLITPSDVVVIRVVMLQIIAHTRCPRGYLRMRKLYLCSSRRPSCLRDMMRCRILLRRLLFLFVWCCSRLCIRHTLTPSWKNDPGNCDSSYKRRTEDGNAKN